MIKTVIHTLFFTLLLLFGVGHISAAQLDIILNHQWNNSKLTIVDEENKPDTDQPIAITNLKYYIGKIEIQYASGKVVKDSMYHLVDETQIGSNKITLSNIPAGEINHISFTIGVDSMTNTEGLMSGDLDPMNGMYWAWNSGYINFKVEGVCKNEEELVEFKYHLGGFLAPNQTAQQQGLKVKKTIKESDTNEQIDIQVNLDQLINLEFIQSKSKILSPSASAKQMAQKLPSIFKWVQ